VSRQITEQTTTIAGIETFLRRTEGPGTPTVFVHGNPTHSAEWLPFMAELEGPAVALDLPNFGRSERVDPERFGGSLHAYTGFLATALDQLVPERFNLVVHDFGAMALHPAQRRAERVERLVIMDGVPLVAGYRWHWVARIWRRRGQGELFNALTSRAAVALLLRQARPGYAAMPAEFVDMIWECWDRGMARAVLRLYRSADPDVLEAAGAHLGRLRCPALVAWGADDPYLGGELARRYAERLPDAELVELDDAGHWPWLDRPELIGRVCEFLGGRPTRV
jgi:pimeloyl-ACP methyl ester carboxylesterase